MENENQNIILSDGIKIKDLVETAFKEIGQVNIVIAGKTGVGKSTLINAVFGENLVKTGVGKPVTQNTKAYTSDNVRGLTLFDTKGFELGDYQAILSDLRDFISSRKTTNPCDHIHICWYCINDFGKRYEKEEIEFIQELQKEIPVIVVFTQTVSDDEFYKTVIQENYNIIHNSVQVLAEKYKFRQNLYLDSFGVDILINKTYELIPECARLAFATAQKKDMELKKKEVTTIITVAAGAAATAGATPIPFSDALLLAPIQITMLAKISSTMGLNLTEGFLSTLVSSAAGVVAATFVGRTVVTNLLKLIPGVGSLAGGTISAVTAGGLTTAMGWAYFNAIKLIFDEGIKPDDIDTKDLAEVFRENLKNIKD